MALPGVCGLQPDLRENYINIGSLYLCTTVFLALGLPLNDPFWNSPNEKWASLKIYHGMSVKSDAALK